MKGKNWYVLAVNSILFIMLGAGYFLVFKIQYGFTLPSVTLGLPLLVGMFFLAYDTVYMIRQKDQKKGMRGLYIGLIALLLSSTLLSYMGSFLLSHPASAPKTYAQTEENRVLAQVLKLYSGFYGQGEDYFVFIPEFTDRYRNLTLEQLEAEKNRIKSRMIGNTRNGEYPGVYEDKKISDLVDNFVTLNLQPGEIAIKSAPEDNYFIDYDHISGIPFDWNSGFIGKIKSFRVSIDKLGTPVSRPYYDKETGLVLLDISKTVYVFYYQDGQVKLVDAIYQYGNFN